MTPPLRLIVNPRAGGGRPARALPAVCERLTRLGLAHRVCETRDLAHARELARGAADAGEISVAFGGDGLIGAVAGALRGGDGVLGVLPGGRGNDFARSLGIPLSPVAACAVLAGGAPRALDVGDIGGRGFVGIASCGLDSDANRIANATRRVPGGLVYAYGALGALARWRPATFTVTLDHGRPRTVDGYTVAVANSRSYGGGMQLAPAADPGDGQLDVVIVGRVSRPRLLARLPTVFSGAHVHRPFVEVVRARSVAIAASRPFTVYADGDPIARLPVTISVAPGAMRVMVPAAVPEPAPWGGPRWAGSRPADASPAGARAAVPTGGWA